MIKWIITLFSINALATIKAYRHPTVDYQFYVQRALGSEKILASSALGSARRYGSAEFPKAIAWRSDLLQERFEELRDARTIILQGQENFPRRPSWLFPDDGCYARAALAVRHIFHRYLPVPNKVFVFGNLHVKTSNHPRGFVSWWYHVAPLVEVNGQKIVLDPAIETARPLRLEEWLARMGPPEKLKVAICASGTYAPSSSCDRESDGLEIRALHAQTFYLREEERRLLRMGRSPERELSDFPPWHQGTMVPPE